MTYRWNLEKIIRADGDEAPEEWAQVVVGTVSALIRTARLALENDKSGYCSDEERASVAADTLEVAHALLSIVDDGTDFLSRRASVGTLKKDAA